MSNTTKPLAPGLLNPKVLLLIGVIALLAGYGLNYFQAQKGLIRLETGKENTLVTNQDTTEGGASAATGPGFAITLDSLNITPHTSAYQIKLMKRDSATFDHASMGNNIPSTLVGLYPLEPMKNTVVDQTEYRFRLKEFYPNFEFAYEYPANRDSIQPKAPGITLELMTKEGTPIVTLHTKLPNKNKLADLVSLGASLAFYWEIPMDSVRAIAADRTKPGNKVVFSGADRRVFFIVNDSIAEQPLTEKSFYKIPGQDSAGFTIIYCFPDMALLKAVPSTRGTELLNPVAHVEIWKEGQGAQDAFVYPESSGRKGGEFEIPGSGYLIGLGIDQEKEVKYCDCKLSIREDGNETAEIVSITSGKSARYKGYSLRPVECRMGHPGKVILEIQKKPGRILMISGVLLAVFAIFLMFLRRKT